MKKEVATALLGLPKNAELTPKKINDAFEEAMYRNRYGGYSRDYWPKVKIEADQSFRANVKSKLIEEARIELLYHTWDKETDKPSIDGGENDRYANRYPSTKSWQVLEASISPVLNTWKTSVGASLGGVLMFLTMLNLENLVPQTLQYLVIASYIQLAYMIFQFIYALVIYPSYFGVAPKFKSNVAISFWNCAAGSFIFGPLWNGNLTNREKGVSYVVFAILEGLVIVSWTFSLGAGSLFLSTMN